MIEPGRLLTAMVTPFDERGEVDYDQARKLALALLDSGSEGLIVVGTTGESPTLVREEEMRLFAEVKSAVGDRGASHTQREQAPFLLITRETVQFNRASDYWLDVDAFGTSADADPAGPADQHDQATATLRAAWKLDAKQGMQKIEQYAGWLQRDWPSAAGSLREGLDEMFTINRLSLPGSLRRCLATTNLIDSTDSGVRQRTRRVTNWQHGNMALRWAAAGDAASAFGASRRIRDAPPACTCHQNLRLSVPAVSPGKRGNHLRTRTWPGSVEVAPRFLASLNSLSNLSRSIFIQSNWKGL